MTLLAATATRSLPVGSARDARVLVAVTVAALLGALAPLPARAQAGGATAPQGSGDPVDAGPAAAPPPSARAPDSDGSGAAVDAGAPNAQGSGAADGGAPTSPTGGDPVDAGGTTAGSGAPGVGAPGVGAPGDGAPSATPLGDAADGGDMGAPGSPRSGAPVDGGAADAGSGAPVDGGAPAAAGASTDDETAGAGASRQGGGAPDLDLGAEAVHYLAWYGAEYALVTGAALWAVLRVDRMLPVLPTVIGPAFDLRSPDLATLNDPRARDEVARPFLMEKVPTLAVVAGGAAVGLSLGVLDVALDPDFHSTHALLLGAAEAGLFPLVASDLVKVFVGRLRPDFRDRYYAAACAEEPVVAPVDGIDCASAPPGLVLDRGDLIDGMRSFPSGHATTSASMATYFGLWLGSRFVWGERATTISRPLGALGIGAVTSLAAFATASRVADHRHHPDDIAVGAALGAAMGAATYFLHFDLDGRAHRRSWSLEPLVVEGGGGLAVAAAIP